MLSNNNSRLSIELLTRKGKNNLAYTAGEKMFFLIKANKDVYFKLYTMGVDKKIYRIYPNNFTNNREVIKAGDEMVSLIQTS